MIRIRSNNTVSNMSAAYNYAADLCVRVMGADSVNASDNNISCSFPSWSYR